MNLTKAPEKGLMYATYIDKMSFEPYCRDELTEAISEEKLLELHLFDQDIEYRVVRTRKGMVENIISDETASYDDVYVEKVRTKRESTCYVEIVNYLTYNEDDQLIINNYRLREAVG